MKTFRRGTGMVKHNGASRGGWKTACEQVLVPLHDEVQLFLVTLHYHASRFRGQNSTFCKSADVFFLDFVGTMQSMRSVYPEDHCHAGVLRWSQLSMHNSHLSLPGHKFQFVVWQGFYSQKHQKWY